MNNKICCKIDSKITNNCIKLQKTLNNVNKNNSDFMGNIIIIGILMCFDENYTKMKDSNKLYKLFDNQELIKLCKFSEEQIKLIDNIKNLFKE